MNRCFDDIESFIQSLQEAASQQKELDRLRRGHSGDPAGNAFDNTYLYMEQSSNLNFICLSKANK